MRSAVSKLLPCLRTESMRNIGIFPCDSRFLKHKLVRSLWIGSARSSLSFDTATNQIMRTAKSKTFPAIFNQFPISLSGLRTEKISSGISRSFHISQILNSDEKDRSNDESSSPVDEEKNENSDKETEDMLVPRKGRRRASGNSQVGLVKRDSKWIPNEVLVIPVYRSLPLMLFTVLWKDKVDTHLCFVQAAHLSGHRYTHRAHKCRFLRGHFKGASRHTSALLPIHGVRRNLRVTRTGARQRPMLLRPRGRSPARGGSCDPCTRALSLRDHRGPPSGLQYLGARDLLLPPPPLLGGVV